MKSHLHKVLLVLGIAAILNISNSYASMEKSKRFTLNHMPNLLNR